MFETAERAVRNEGGVGSSASVREQARRLRLKIAVNLFKRFLLGASHQAGLSQVEEILGSATAGRLFELIDVRTWASWFLPSSPVPKRTTIQALDQVAQECIRIRFPRDDLEYRLSPRFFEELVHGGLLAALDKTAESKRARASLGDAIDQYCPLSAWHLHMDAVEISGLATGIGGLSWQHVKQAAALHLMSVLYGLWAPRTGGIYRMFASDLRLRWNAAPEEERRRMRGRSSISPSSYFDTCLRAAPVPDWSAIGVGGDLAVEHIHKALLAMVADPAFLIAERKHAWALDLASSALAMHALAWSDRYQTFGHRVTEEQVCWRLFSEVLFALDVRRPVDHRAMSAGMACLGLPWSRLTRRVLLDGGASYKRELKDLGLEIPPLLAVARHATKAHPLVYHGG